MLASLQNIKILKFDFNSLLNKVKSKYNSRIYADNTVFLDGTSQYEDIVDRVDIVLSPKFYWIRKSTLPVKRIYQAKKIVPSFFSDILPEGNYKYKILKRNDDFLLFAYQVEPIIKAIKNAKIDISLVNKIFFAQVQFDKFNAIDIGSECILLLKDDIIVKAPKSIFLEEIQSVDIKYAIRNITKSTTFITIGNHSKQITSNMSHKLIWLLSFLMVFYFIEYTFVKKELTKLIQKKEHINKVYKIPSSTIKLNSIIQALNSKRVQSIKSRQTLASVLKIPIIKGDILKKVSFKTSGKSYTFIAQIILAKKENSSIYKDYLAKRFNIKSAKVKDLIMTIKGEL